MSVRLIALLASLAVAAPAAAQSKLVVVLRGGRVQTFDLADVERIEFAGGPLAGAVGVPGAVSRSPVGTWDWVDRQTLVIQQDGRFALYRYDQTQISEGRLDVLDPSARRYRLVHARGGYVDTVTMSPDGMELAGASSTGYKLQGRRRAAPTGTQGSWTFANDPEEVLPGSWDFGDGRTVVIRPEQSVEVWSGGRQVDDGRWDVLDRATGRFRLAYRQGGAEVVTLGPDGRTLEGTNARGQRVWARR